MSNQAPMTVHLDILAALARQLECYQRLAKLAERQREHVEQSNTEALLAVLAQRQAVMDDLAPLEQILAPIKRGWAAFVAGLPAELRERAETTVAAARRLLEQITRADQADVMILQQRKITLGLQLSQASASRQVNRAYASSAYGRAPTRMDVSK